VLRNLPTAYGIIISAEQEAARSVASTKYNNSGKAEMDEADKKTMFLDVLARKQREAYSKQKKASEVLRFLLDSGVNPYIDPFSSKDKKVNPGFDPNGKIISAKVDPENSSCQSKILFAGKRTISGANILFLALERGGVDCVDVLLEHGGMDVNTEFDSVADGDTESSELADSNLDGNNINPGKESAPDSQFLLPPKKTLLHAACAMGDARMLEFLVEKKKAKLERKVGKFHKVRNYRDASNASFESGAAQDLDKRVRLVPNVSKGGINSTLKQV
jgi:hypothetical protein